MDKKLALTILFNGVDKLSGNLKNIVGLGEKGGTALARMRREAKSLERELAGVRTGIAGGTGNVTALIERERELELKVAAANRQFERQGKLLAINNRVGKMQARSAQLMASGQNNLFGGAMMAAPFVLATKSAMEFSSGLVDLQQKAELTDRQMVSVRANILAAAMASHQLPEDMRSAVGVLAGFGMDVRQASQLALPIGRLGTAFKVELADGAAAAYANINNLKLQARDTGRAFDIMAAAGNAGAFEIKDMARYFPGLTAQAQTLGMRGVPAVADLSAALEIARRATGDAEGAATNLGDLMAKIYAPVTINAFKKNFGIDLPKAMDTFTKSGMTSLEAIAMITKQATGGDMKKLGFAFRNQQARMAVTALIQNMDDYRKMRDEIGKSGGTVDRAFGQREANDGALAWQKFRVQLSVTALTLGGKLLPVASQFLAIASRILNTVGDFAQANPRLTTTLLYLAAAGISAKLGMGALQLAFGGILGPAASAWGLLMKFRALGGVPAIIEGISAVLPALGVALDLALGPVGLVILAVAALAFAIYHWWGPISGYFKKHWTFIRNLFLGAAVIFFPIVAAVVLVATTIYRNWDRISGSTMDMVNKIRGIVGPFCAPFIAIGKFFVGLQWTFIKYGANLIWGLIKGIASMNGEVWKAIGNLVSGIGGRFAALLGIKSPSRVFMQYGGHLTEGLAIGVDRGRRRPIAAVGRLATGVAGAMAMGAGAPAMAGGGAGGGGAPVTINITIQQQPGEDARALAVRVADEIERRQQTKQRGAYRDD